MPFHLAPFAAAAMVLFAAVSVVLGGFIAGAGGWRALAERYPAGATLGNGAEERFRFASLRTSGGALGTAAYGSCVMIGVGDRGISLDLWAPFRLWHPALFIPWAAVEGCRRLAHMVGPVTQVRIRGGETLTFAGRAGEAVARRCPVELPRNGLPM
ncbi:MAG TPA: hypothetical protein VEB59_04565 [Gemmatimonadales bacterium]|nr:hypothetical protein [Gemmatimonadales bacterium]